jgi:hypothetical protein
MQFPGDQGTAVVAMAMESQGKKFFVEVDDNYLDRGDELWRLAQAGGDRSATRRTRPKGHRVDRDARDGVIVTTRR